MRPSTTGSFFDVWKAALVAIALLLVLAACTDAAEDVTPTATSAPTATTPAMAPDPTATTASMPAEPTATAAPMAPDPTPTTASMPAEPTATAESMAPPADPIPVVTTTNIVADWVSVVGGDRVEVFSLLPVGADPHSYQPGARDVTKIADAELVLSVGLGLEESWLHELVENAARDEESIVEIAEFIDPIEFAEAHSAEAHSEDGELLEALDHMIHEVEDGEISAEEGLEEVRELLEGMGEEHDDHGHGEEEDSLHARLEAILEQVDAGQLSVEAAIEEFEHIAHDEISHGEEMQGGHEGHDHGSLDPHFWFDPIRVKVAVEDIAARLSAMDPEGAVIYFQNAAAYSQQLDELHAWIQEQVSAIPEEDRLLVTSHDSLGYFAQLYGFEVVGVILGATTEVEPSAEDLIELIHEIEESGARAVFGETTVSERLAEAIASESDTKLVRLYSGSLGGEGSGAETYLGMFRANVERIVEALS